MFMFHVPTVRPNFGWSPRLSSIKTTDYKTRRLLKSNKLWRKGEMKSPKLGTRTSDVEVTNIDRHGFWLFIKGKEYFLPYEEYPWFKDARIRDILNVELLHGNHLHWPDLDVDLSLNTLEIPHKYPLIYY